MLLLLSADFSKKFYYEHYQSVCKGSQKMTKVAVAIERVKCKLKARELASLQFCSSAKIFNRDHMPHVFKIL